VDLILEFVKTGGFVGISVGDDVKSALGILGAPDERVRLNRMSQILHFGHLELYICDECVDRIYLKINDWDIVLPANIEKFNTHLSELNSLDDLIVYLDENAVSWVVDKNSTDNDTVCILSEDRVGIFYSLSSHGIYSIGTNSFDISRYLTVETKENR